MSRKLFAFLLSELTTARVICRKCEGVSEVSIKRMATGAGLVCPSCGQSVIASDITKGSTPLMQLADAIAELKAHGSTVDIEFILPDPSA